MMGEFNGKIHAEFSPPKTWTLEKTLSFVTKELTDSEIECLHEVGANISITGIISAEKGMKTDLASVPRLVWAVIAPWDVARAAVIHDHLYAELRLYYDVNVRNCKVKPTKTDNKKLWSRARGISDKIFLLGMHSAEPEVSSFKKYSAYWAVRVFGSGPASANVGLAD